MVKQIMMTSTAHFYESIRNKYNQMTVLRKEDYVYDIEDGSEWQLLENPDKGGSANSVCTYAPKDSVFRLGMEFKRCYFDENGILRHYLRIGKVNKK